MPANKKQVKNIGFIVTGIISSGAMISHVGVMKIMLALYRPLLAGR